MDKSKGQLLKSHDSLEKNSDSEVEESDFDILNDFWSGKRIAYRYGLYSLIQVGDVTPRN